MSEKKKSALQEHPPVVAADSTRNVLLELVESFKFSEAIRSICKSYGKTQALEDLYGITAYIAQCVIITESDPPAVSSDQIWLLQLLYELISSLPPEQAYEDCCDHLHLQHHANCLSSPKS